MNQRLTDEHGFWGIFWFIAFGVSLFWDAALGRTPDAAITLFDVTSLTLCLAVGCRVQMRRSNRFRCYSSLAIYLTTHWVRDWFVVLLVSCVGVPVLGLALCATLPYTGVTAPFALYGLLTALLPTWKLLRNVRLLQAADDPNERWLFRERPHWIWN